MVLMIQRSYLPRDLVVYLFMRYKYPVFGFSIFIY